MSRFPAIAAAFTAASVAALCVVTAAGGRQAVPTAPVPPTPAAVGAVAAADLAFVDQTLPVFIASGQSVAGTVFVSNAAKDARTIEIAGVLRDASGRSVDASFALDPTPGSTGQIPGGGAIVPVRFTVTAASLSSLGGDALPLDGWLTVRDDKGQSTKPIALKIRPGSGGASDWQVFKYSAIGAAVVSAFVIVFVVGTEDAGVLLHRMGGATWSFTESWSSTITVAAGLLTTFVGLAGLPEQGHILSRGAYGVASALSAALITLAPGVYNLFRRPIVVPVAGGPDKIEYQGLVVMFIAAAAFTISGALAQLGLLRFVLRDLAWAGVISHPLADHMAIVWFALQGATLLYALTSMIRTIAAKPQAGGPHVFMLRAPGSAAPAPLPQWPLL